jgi:pyruvate dehydrogenase (quinone)
LATIVQYNLPIKIIVFNNRSLGMVKLEMEVMGLPEWQTKMYNPDFTMIAEAMGLKGFTLRDPALVEETIIRVLGYDGPALVNVFTDSNALAMPPKVDFKQIKGMATAMCKMVLEGEFWEVVEKVKANYKHAKELM